MTRFRLNPDQGRRKMTHCPDDYDADQFLMIVNSGSILGESLCVQKSIQDIEC